MKIVRARTQPHHRHQQHKIAALQLICYVYLTHLAFIRVCVCASVWPVLSFISIFKEKQTSIQQLFIITFYIMKIHTQQISADELLSNQTNSIPSPHNK